MVMLIKYIGCENWYHPKCIKMSEEEFQYHKDVKNKWHCSDCNLKKIIK